MTKQFTARIPDSAESAAVHRSVLASLPNHFRIVASGEADAALCEDASLIPHEATRVILWAGGPCHALPSASIVVPELQFAPQLLADTAFASARASAFSLIVISLQTANPIHLQHALFEQLTLVRALTGGSPRLSSVERSGAGFIATGSVGEHNAAVLLSCFPSPTGAAKLSLAAVSPTSRLQAEIDASASSRPALIRFFGPEGVNEKRQIHQNSRRLTWMTIYKLLSDHAATAEIPRKDIIADWQTVSLWLG